MESGAQPNNTNSVRHGTRSKRAGLVLPRMGKRYASIYHDLCLLRKSVEDHIREVQGEPGPRQVARVQTLLRLEAGCRSLEHEIRESGSERIPLKDLISARNAIVTWTRQRDNLLAELLGDKQSSGDDPFEALDAERAAATAWAPGEARGSRDGREPSDATGDAVGPVGSGPDWQDTPPPVQPGAGGTLFGTRGTATIPKKSRHI